MSRFADPTKTDVFTLPNGCKCPGTPHETDWIRMRTEAGGADMLAIARNDDPPVVVALLATDWNLLDDDGKPAPLDREHVDRLFGDSYEGIDVWIREHVTASSLGKAIGATSSTTSSGKARQNRRSRRRHDSTK